MNEQETAALQKLRADAVGAMAKDFYGMKVPDHVRPGMVRYIFDFIPVGDFLQAVIANDLKGAVAQADDENIRNLPAIVNWFYNWAPGNCWGSREAYHAWLQRRTEDSTGQEQPL